MRIRYLKPSFFKDADVAKLPREYRLLFQGLWLLADREGRLEDRPDELKAELFPYEEIDIERGLKALAKVKPLTERPFIVRYVVDNERFIQIVNWHKHQRPHHTEKPSKIPPCVNGDLTVKERLGTGEVPLGMGMGMGKGRKEKKDTLTEKAKDLIRNLTKQ